MKHFRAISKDHSFVLVLFTPFIFICVFSVSLGTRMYLFGPKNKYCLYFDSSTNGLLCRDLFITNLSEKGSSLNSVIDWILLVVKNSLSVSQ